MKVIAVEFIVQPGDAKTFEDAMLRHARNSRAEPGCKRFDVARDPDQPGRYLLWENYEDDDAVAFHRAQDSMKEVGKILDPLVVEKNVSLVDMVEPV